MKTTVNVYAFRDAFNAVRPENFSYEGLGLLFDYLEELEESMGEELELDVIALCCDWAESSADEIVQDFDLEYVAGISHENLPDADEYTSAVLEYLNENTSVAGVTDAGTIVYQSF